MKRYFVSAAVERVTDDHVFIEAESAEEAAEKAEVILRGRFGVIDVYDVEAEVVDSVALSETGGGK